VAVCYVAGVNNPLAAARGPLAVALETAIAAGVTPGAALGVVTREGHHATLTLGETRYREGEPVTPETRYDLASLTKVMATLPLVLQAVAAGELGLDDPVGRYFSSAGWFQTPSLADVPVRALLTHSGGLPAWRPLYAQLSDRRTALAAVLNSPVDEPGEVVYSDLGFMLLGALIERLHHARLDRVAERNLFAPLGLAQTGFGPIAGPGVAPTEECGWRDRLLIGEVHDENATVWEGVAGHAGLFAPLADLLRYAHAWLSLDVRLAPAELLREASRVQVHASDGGARGLGWVAAGPVCFVGARPHGYGHTGFTGTSVWIDPHAGYAWVLLTNRVHPRRGDTAGIVALRKQLQKLLDSGTEEPR
jgi:CubicO group peptidase (beta-lactamase class C family)